MTIRAGASLRLYLYREDSAAHARPYRVVRSGRLGEFDFGDLPKGHYTLEIEVPWGADVFDVEIIKSNRVTKSIVIDASPVHPDCTSGHEFVVEYD